MKDRIKEALEEIKKKKGKDGIMGGEVQRRQKESGDQN